MIASDVKILGREVGNPIQQVLANEMSCLVLIPVAQREMPAGVGAQRLWRSSLLHLEFPTQAPSGGGLWGCGGAGGR